MDNSSNFIKRNSRISVTRKHRLSDSPKTPNRNKKPARINGYETPPSTSELNNADSPNATPLSNRNIYFGEESPSQDYDYSLIPMSQDTIGQYRDVTWKWDDNEILTTVHNKKKEFLQAITTNRKSQKSQEKNDKTKKFNKFQELLLAKDGNLKNLLKNNNRLYCNNNLNDDMGSSFKENFDIVLENENNIKEKYCKTKDESVLKNKKELIQLQSIETIETITNLLDDSATDTLLVELTQNIENNITTESKVPFVVNLSPDNNNLLDGICFERENNIIKATESKESLFVNLSPDRNGFEHDSIDELLLSLPMNDNAFVPNISSKFSRHHSMPSPIQEKNNQKNNSNSLIRYSSSSNLKSKPTVSTKSLQGDGKVSPFSEGSLDSVYSSATDMHFTVKCSKAEVEMKRQEAKLRRTQSQKKRQLSLKQQNCNLYNKK